MKGPFSSNIKFSRPVKCSNTGSVTPKFTSIIFSIFELGNSFKISFIFYFLSSVMSLPFGNKLIRFSEETTFCFSGYFLQHFCNKIRLATICSPYSEDISLNFRIVHIILHFHKLKKLQLISRSQSKKSF